MLSRLICFFLFFFIIVSSASAHPHIFLKNKVKVVFDQNGLKGFKTIWFADDFSTAALTDGYDDNENGLIDSAEIKIFENDSVENLKKFNYFSHITIGNKPITIKTVKDFKAELIDGKIVYSFFIPCELKAGNNDSEITIAQYDSSYFSFISFSEEQPAEIINGNHFNTNFKIEENKKESYYFDMVHPVHLILRFKKS